MSELGAPRALADLLGGYDVGWHQGLVEGTDVTLTVTATVTKDGFTFKKATDTAGAQLTERKTLSVHSFEIVG